MGRKPKNVDGKVEVRPKKPRGRPKGTTKKQITTQLTPYTCLRLSPTCSQFYASSKREVLLVGGRRAGKSVALCAKMVEQASIPGNTVILARKYMQRLKKSTLRILLHSDGDRPPILPYGTYTYNKVDGIIELNGGGTIMVVGGGEEFSVKGLACSAAFLDEATEFNEDDYQNILRTISSKTGTGQLYACTNPANTTHFLYKYFELDKNPNREVFYVNALENEPNLHKNAIEALKELQGDRRRRDLEGKWVAEEGLIYGNSFNHSNNVMDEDYMSKIRPQITQWYICVDKGFTHPTGMLLIGLLDDQVFIFEEYRKSGQLLSDIHSQIEKWIHLQPTIIIDPSAADWINECQAKGWTCIKANNDVELGIDRVKDGFVNKKIKIHCDCEDLISEIQTYSRDTETNKIIKVEDDLVDPLRYFQNHYAEIMGAPKPGKVYIF